MASLDIKPADFKTVPPVSGRTIYFPSDVVIPMTKVKRWGRVEPRETDVVEDFVTTVAEWYCNADGGTAECNSRRGQCSLFCICQKFSRVPSHSFRSL